MYLLAVSGGPDSMFLLDQHKAKNIIVAHVNYHRRHDASHDTAIVKSFCQTHHLPYQILNVKTQPKGNFQAWARQVRYDFFKKLYDTYNCKALLMAHHKDDFLETAIMQQESGRTPRYFGIKKQNQLGGMRILRPYVNAFWKTTMVQSNQTHNIAFAIDSSNKNPIYKRNQVRAYLHTKTKQEKQSMFAWFMMANKILKKKFKRVDRQVKKIIAHDHPLKMYRQLNIDAVAVVYEIMHKKLGTVKLSSSKIRSFIAFVNGQEGGKKFIINNNSYVVKKNKKLSYITT